MTSRKTIRLKRRVSRKAKRTRKVSRKAKRTRKVSRKRTRKVSRKGRKVSRKGRKVSRKGRRRLKGGFFDTIKSSLGKLTDRMKAEASFLRAHPYGDSTHMHGTKRTLCGHDHRWT